MGFRYIPGVDILALLKEAGYSTYQIAKHKMLSASTMTKIRNGQMISLPQIEEICKLLKCHPDKLIEYTDDT